MSIHVKDGGVWKEVTAGNGMYVKDAGVWKPVLEGHVKDGGVWKSWFQMSDPLTLSFYPTWTNCYGETHFEQPEYTMSPIGSSLYTGDFDTIGHPSGMQTTYGVVRFDESLIATNFGGRTVVSSINLRLTVRAQYTSLGISPVINSSTYAFTNSKPTDLGASAPALANQTIGTRTKYGNSVTTALPTTVGDDIIGGTVKGLILYHPGTDTPSKELYRGGYYDTTDIDSRKPLLTITADFA